MTEIKAAITEVKLAKATKAYWDDVAVYGRELSALKALDCVNREEAIQMLTNVQTVHVFKRDGKIVIQ